MDNRVKQYLFDIEKCIADVELFMATIRSFEEFEKDTLLKRAIEREIEIIGEAMNRILKIEPSIQISNARKMVGARNKIIHGYDEIDDTVIYGIVKRGLPQLKKEIQDL